jgi:hypothetical protein
MCIDRRDESILLPIDTATPVLQLWFWVAKKLNFGIIELPGVEIMDGGCINGDDTGVMGVVVAGLK